MRILIDADGVMVEFVSMFLTHLHYVTGRKHTVDEITDFHFETCICTPEEGNQVWARIAEQEGAVLELRPYEGVERALQLLRLDHELVCVTSPQWGTRWAEERYHWLVKHGFNKQHIVFASNKALVQGDVLIEDSPSNLESWLAAHPHGNGVLIAQPWNQKKQSEGPWLTVPSLLHYAEMLMR